MCGSCPLIAASTNLLDLVTAGDWLIRLRRTTLARLHSAVQGYSGRGAVAARAAMKLVRERVDSPRETWLRLCLVLAGLPMPECNLVIGDDQGPIGRVDLVCMAYRLIIEYEGDQHRTDASGTATLTDKNSSPVRSGPSSGLPPSGPAGRGTWSARFTRPSKPNGYSGPPHEFSEPEFSEL